MDSCILFVDFIFKILGFHAFENQPPHHHHHQEECSNPRHPSMTSRLASTTTSSARPTSGRRLIIRRSSPSTTNLSLISWQSQTTWPISNSWCMQPPTTVSSRPSTPTVAPSSDSKLLASAYCRMIWIPTLKFNEWSFAKSKRRCASGLNRAGNSESMAKRNKNVLLHHPRSLLSPWARNQNKMKNLEMRLSEGRGTGKRIKII